VADEILRVLRGGSWHNFRFSARCSVRVSLGPDYWGGFCGFRVAASPII